MRKSLVLNKDLSGKIQLTENCLQLALVSLTLRHAIKCCIKARWSSFLVRKAHWAKNTAQKAISSVGLRLDEVASLFAQPSCEISYLFVKNLHESFKWPSNNFPQFSLVFREFRIFDRQVCFTTSVQLENWTCASQVTCHRCYQLTGNLIGGHHLASWPKRDRFIKKRFCSLDRISLSTKFYTAKYAGLIRQDGHLLINTCSIYNRFTN